MSTNYSYNLIWMNYCVCSQNEAIFLHIDVGWSIQWRINFMFTNDKQDIFLTPSYTVV
jgi:hypothetical protein